MVPFCDTFTYLKLPWRRVLGNMLVNEQSACLNKIEHFLSNRDDRVPFRAKRVFVVIRARMEEEQGYVAPSGHHTDLFAGTSFTMYILPRLSRNAGKLSQHSE